MKSVCIYNEEKQFIELIGGYDLKGLQVQKYQSVKIFKFVILEKEKDFKEILEEKLKAKSELVKDEKHILFK